MKKTVKINLGGIIFHLDEDAYEKFKTYLDSLNQRFEGIEEGREIIIDIETRIAEIFQSKLTDQKQVITIEDVEEVIKIMGKPEDFIDDEETNGNTHKEKVYESAQRRLFRDPDNAIIGGVCSGLAAYFRISPIIVRILFFLFIPAYGIPIALYIVLWIVAPMAETTAQKLEMKGENITISNIEKSVREELDSVKENIKKMKRSHDVRESRNVFHETFHAIGMFFVAIIKIILIIIGISLMLAGFIALVSFLGVFFFNHIFFFTDTSVNFSVSDMLTIFTDQGNVTLIMICLFLTVTIPLMALIYGGIKLIFRFKANDKIVGLTSFMCWFLSVVILAGLTFSEMKHYFKGGTSTEQYSLENFTSDTIFLEVGEADYYDFGDELFMEISDFAIYWNEEDKQVYGEPELYIRKATGDIPELYIKKESRGESTRAANQNAKEIEYFWEERDSVLIFNPFYTIESGNKWRGQYLEITLRVPENKVICLGDNIDEILDYIYYDDKYTRRTWNLIGKKFKMTEEGLVLLD